MNIEGRIVVKRNAGFTFIAGFDVLIQVFAVDGFCQYTAQVVFPIPLGPVNKNA